MYIQHLNISCFRGVGRPIDLPLQHRTIIYGPNGSGKSSILQAIAWTFYGKLPMYVGGVFSKEDAFVNDFSDDGKADVTLTLSDGRTIQRQRKKKSSTSSGITNPILSFSADDPQIAVEQLLGLNSEEFFAAVFLQQETIRDFLTTTPEKRSATIDRMIGTFLLRTLIKLIDPGIPEKAIYEAKKEIERLNTQLSQASVINREVIQKKKEQYGNPESLPKVLYSIKQKLTPAIDELELAIPKPTLENLSNSLAVARKTQLELVGVTSKQVEELVADKRRYEIAAEKNWIPIYKRKEKYGDPIELASLLNTVHSHLIPICEKLNLSQPSSTLTALENALSAARRAQPKYVSQLEQQKASLSTLQNRHRQAAITNWEGVVERKAQFGDPSSLPTLLVEIREEMMPILKAIELATPKVILSDLESSLKDARKALPRKIADLERHATKQLALKEQYQQLSGDIVEDISVPPEQAKLLRDLENIFNKINLSIQLLMRQRNDLKAKEENVKDLNLQIKSLPKVRTEIKQLQSESKKLDVISKQGELFNQILSIGSQYIQQNQPEQCPLCKQDIRNIGQLLDFLHSETPADVEKIRQEYDELQEQLDKKQAQLADMLSKQSQLIRLQNEISKFPDNLDEQIAEKQKEAEQITDDIVKAKEEISKIEDRIKLARENRERLQNLMKEINSALGKAPGKDVVNTLISAASEAQREATKIEEFDFQPISDRLTRADKIKEIGDEERRLQDELNKILLEIKKAIGSATEEEISNKLKNAIEAIRIMVDEVQALDFQPAADGLERAKQLQQIEEEEKRLTKELKDVQTEIRQKLNLPSKETNLKVALDNAIEESRKRASKIRALSFQQVEADLQIAEQLVGIQKDEAQLRELESNYKVVEREKARIEHRISRLTELREALQDISETTKRHQESIVINILSNLDIHRYYQQLDPHPAYANLQIEPELTNKGTYNYWIKALTKDLLYSTYVQTRFSTAQANCAAIAIFLAVNQHLSKDLETILLDDPSQSMDSDHKQRLASTLASSPRQVVVVTEDPEMLQFLRNTFDKPAIYELSPWTTEGSNIAKKL